MVGANSATMLRTIRKKYPNLFLLVDGLDVSGANARNASCGFDSLGHGALCCAGSSIMGAWKEHPELSPLEAAVESAERMKRNITRYVTILMISLFRDTRILLIMTLEIFVIFYSSNP